MSSASRCRPAGTISAAPDGPQADAVPSRQKLRDAAVERLRGMGRYNKPLLLLSVTILAGALACGYWYVTSQATMSGHYHVHWTFGTPQVVDGVLLGHDNSPVHDVSIAVDTTSGLCTDSTDSKGRFRIVVPEQRINSIEVDGIEAAKWRFGLPVANGVSFTLQRRGAQVSRRRTRRTCEMPKIG